MEIEWVEAFVAVTEVGSFSEAAEGLFLSQSVVSKRVQKLERQLNARLLNRSRRQLELTDAGQRVLPQAQALLRQYHALKEAAHPHGSLRLAMLPVADCYGFPQLLADFAAEHPGLRLTVEERENTAMPTLLRAGLCDGAFYRTADRSLPERALLLREEEMVLMLPAGRCGSKGDNLPLSRLANERFLLLSAGTGLLEPSLALFRQAGFAPQVGYTGASAANIARMVRGGAGIALLSRQVAQSCGGDGLRLLTPRPTFQSRLIFCPSTAGLQNPAMPALLRFLRSAAK